MSLHKQPELKKAVLDLSPKEKDKLLVRLVSKDKMLMKQLHFQLLEDSLDLEDRIEKLRKRLEELFRQAEETIKNSSNMQDMLMINKLLKQCSALINEHEKVTKDKMSEVEFRLYILSESCRKFPKLFDYSHLLASQKLLKYFSLRVKHILAKYQRLHADLQFEYRDELQELLDFGFNSALHNALESLSIPKEI